MKMSKLLRSKMNTILETDRFWIESAKLDFALSIEHERKRANKSYADVASSLGTSPAYITKVFRGDANLTIESMVKLARSFGCNLEIKLKDAVADALVTKEWLKSPKPHTGATGHEFLTVFFAEEAKVQIGRFNLPKQARPSNDHKYQNAA